MFASSLIDEASGATPASGPLLLCFVVSLLLRFFARMLFNMLVRVLGRFLLAASVFFILCVFFALSACASMRACARAGVFDTLPCEPGRGPGPRILSYSRKRFSDPLL